MMPAMASSLTRPLILFTAACVAVLLLGSVLHVGPLMAVSKTLASLGFIALGLRHGTPRGSDSEARFAAAILAALGLSLLGDVALLGRGELPFLLGLGSFLLAHVAFCVAFLRLGLRPQKALWTFVPLAVVAVAVLAWLLGFVPAPMRAPVVVYVTVITAMVSLSGATRVAAEDPRRLILPLAAGLFYLSDLSVALDRFVAPAARHWLWGLPLYYLAQVLFALCVRRPVSSG